MSLAGACRHDPGMRIEPGDLAEPAVRSLLGALDAYLATLYPPASNHGLTMDALRQPAVRFVVARLGDAPVGCGAVVLEADDAEIKRMYVAPAARGRGVGRRLLDHLESLAMASGCRTSRLETGIAQPEALALYRRAGYMDIGPFADYRPDPQSRFMGKPLHGIEAVLGRAGSFP